MVQSFAQQQHDIGLAEASRSVVEAGVGDAVAQGVSVVDEAPGLLDCEYRQARAFHQGLKLLGTHGVSRRVAHDHDWPLRPAQQVDGFGNQCWIAVGAPTVAVLAGLVGRHVLFLYAMFLYVHGNGQVHWTRAA